MAKPLVFKFNGGDVAFQLNKIDRSKLYGYKELEALDAQGGKCELATLAGDGRTVVGRGGASFATLDADGRWCEKSQLTPIDPEGQKIVPVPSSYAAPIESLQVCEVSEYLEHNIRLVYALEAEVAPLAAELKQGIIFKFPYSFRGGLEADAGFLLSGDDGNLFLCVGNPTKVEWIGLAQAAAATEDDSEIEEMDMMDFDMI